MVFGTVSVPVLYLLGRELTDRAEALIAAGLLAVSYHHIWFSQNARGYTGLLLAALLATWCLVQGLRKPGWRPWLLYAVTVALGMYTHLTMIFVAISHALVCGWWVMSGEWLVVRRDKPTHHSPLTTHHSPPDWRRPAVGFVLAGTLTLLLYAPMLADVQNFFLHKPTGMKAVSTPRWALVETWNSLQKGLGGNATVTLPVLLGAGLILGCGLGSYWRHNRIVLALCVLPGLITLCGALAVRGTMYPRFFFYLLGFGLLIVARGITVASRGVIAFLVPDASPRLGQRVGAWMGGGLAALLMACFAASLGTNYRYPKQDFEGAMNYIEAQQEDGEPVLTAGVAATFCYQRYYHRPWEEARTAGQLATICGTRPVWLVYTFPRYLEVADADLAAMIRERFTVVPPFPARSVGRRLGLSRGSAAPNHETDERNEKKQAAMKLIIQIPCFNEAKTLPLTIPALPAWRPWHRRGRVPGDRRRQHRQYRRGRPRPGCPPRRPLPAPRPGGHLHGRPRGRGPPGRRHHRQYRRRQPVPGRRHRPPGRADPGGACRAGRGRPRRGQPSALLAAEAPFAAAGQLGHRQGLGPENAGRHQRLPRLQPRHGPADPGAQRLLLHTGDAHPGRGTPQVRGVRPGRHQSPTSSRRGCSAA